MFSLQCPLSSLLSECGIYVSETGKAVFRAREEETRHQSSGEGKPTYIMYMVNH